MIREATPADEPALRRLQHELREYDPALLSYAVSGPPLVLVAGAADGYLLAVLDEEAYLAELAVAPGRRRQGVASALLEELHDRARSAGANAVELVVHPENDAALELYASVGYDRVGCQEDFYADADGIVMRRDL